MQLVLLIQGLPVKLSFSLVLQNEFVVFGLLIYKHQQNGLASCSTEISGHELGN